VFGPLSGRNNLFQLFDDGHDDTFDFPHTTPARIVGILIVALVLTQLLNVASRHLSEVSKSPRLALRRATQICTLSKCDLQRWRVRHYVSRGDADTVKSQHQRWSAARLGPRHRGASGRRW